MDKAEVITYILTSALTSKLAHIPSDVIGEAYDLALGMLPINIQSCFVPSLGMAFLTCNVLDNFNLQDVYDSAGDPIEGENADPDLWRTIGSQAIDGVSVNFESERLSLGLDGALEQFMSVGGYGDQALTYYKNCVKSLVPIVMG